MTASSILDLIFVLNNNFDLGNFTGSVERISKKLNIPIYIKNIEESVIPINIEIYFFIYSNRLEIFCSHKFYDGQSIFKILDLIDNEYNNIDNKEEIFIDPNIINNKNTCSAITIVSLPISIMLNLNRKDRLCSDNMDNYMSLLTKTKTDKTIDIINEIQILFNNYTMFIGINIRKTLNLHKYTIGNYVVGYCLKSNDKNLISNIKKCKNLDDFVKSFSDHDDCEEQLILNSFMQYKYPSFIDDMIFDDNKFVNKVIIITPKNKEGYSNVYISRVLKEILEKNNEMHPNKIKI
jgi:hypothetical protein